MASLPVAYAFPCVAISISPKNEVLIFRVNLWAYVAPASPALHGGEGASWPSGRWAFRIASLVSVRQRRNVMFLMDEF